MLEPICLCSRLPRIDNRATVVLVPHHLEWRRSSNTGRLAVLCLRRSELFLHGAADRPLEPSLLARPGHRHVLLHPGADAPMLRHDPTRPVRLIVPDGSWRQSHRIARALSKRIEGLERARVDATAMRSLRRPPEPGFLSTGEAIAAALAALDEPVTSALLREALGWMVDRSLYVRGMITAHEVRGGISTEARRRLSGSHGR